MNLIDAFLRTLGFRELVKNGKDFDQLTQCEIATMIHDHLAGREDAFDRDAIYEFMDNPGDDPTINEIRARLREIEHANRTNDHPDGLTSDAGRAQLRSLADGLS